MVIITNGLLSNRTHGLIRMALISIDIYIKRPDKQFFSIKIKWNNVKTFLEIKKNKKY